MGLPLDSSVGWNLDSQDGEDDTARLLVSCFPGIIVSHWSLLMALEFPSYVLTPHFPDFLF